VLAVYSCIVTGNTCKRAMMTVRFTPPAIKLKWLSDRFFWQNKFCSNYFLTSIMIANNFTTTPIPSDEVVMLVCNFSYFVHLPFCIIKRQKFNSKPGIRKEYNSWLNIYSTFDFKGQFSFMLFSSLTTNLEVLFWNLLGVYTCHLTPKGSMLNFENFEVFSNSKWFKKKIVVINVVLQQ